MLPRESTKDLRHMRKVLLFVGGPVGVHTPKENKHFFLLFEGSNWLNNSQYGCTIE